MLSEKELVIVRSIVSGDSSKVIAKKLGISPATVRKHRENIFKRIDVHSAVQLASWWRSVSLEP